MCHRHFCTSPTTYHPPRPPPSDGSGRGASKTSTGALRVPSVASPLTTHTAEWTDIFASFVAHLRNRTRRLFREGAPPSGNPSRMMSLYCCDMTDSIIYLYFRELYTYVNRK